MRSSFGVWTLCAMVACGGTAIEPARDASPDVFEPEASSDAGVFDAKIESAADAGAKCPPRAGDPCEVGQMWCDEKSDTFVWMCHFGMWEAEPCGAPIALCTNPDGGPYVCRGSFCK